MWAPLLQVLLVAATPNNAAPVMHERCAADSQPWRRAQQNIDALDKLVQGKSSDTAALRTALTHLLKGPCIARPEAPWTSAALSAALGIRTWWQDGGKAWAAGQLSNPRTLTLAPSFRSELTLDVAPTDPLARLLCRDADAECGRETRGWVDRAEESFVVQRANEASRTAQCSGAPRGDAYSDNLYDALNPDAGQATPVLNTLDEPLLKCAQGTPGYLGWLSCVQRLRIADPGFLWAAFERLARDGS